MRQTVRLFGLLLRGYVRDRTALFFSLVVPLMLMVIFGYLNLGDFGRVSVAIDDQAKNQSSKQLIDILGMLREKTRNNLEPGEESLLDSVLYDLRMRYVELVRQKPKEGT